MPCYKPLKGWIGRMVTKNGKHPVVFNIRDGYADLKVEIPCGQCIGCRLERSRQWAIRCMHEAKLHKENCFITLTYNDDNLPKNGSLVMEDFQLFMKRLRKEVEPKKIKFFHCGEYGEKLGRPHYHACLFGVDFKDKKLYYNRGNHVYSSDTLKRLWPYGFNVVGDVTFESAAYVARYITKKVTGERAENHYSAVNCNTGEITKDAPGYKKPEYVTMSRGGRTGKGLGFGWFQKYKDDVYPSDSVIVRGKEMKPPKYYDSLLGEKEIMEVKAKRKNLPENVKEDNGELRLRVKEKITERNLKEFKRRYEND